MGSTPTRLRQLIIPIRGGPFVSPYGDRGIFVCPEWSNTPEGYERFLHDMKIPNGIRPRGMSLDRIDVDGPYSAQNCKWSTDLEQANNKQVHKRARIALIGNDWFTSSYDVNYPY